MIIPIFGQILSLFLGLLTLGLVLSVRDALLGSQDISFIDQTSRHAFQKAHVFDYFKFTLASYALLFLGWVFPIALIGFKMLSLGSLNEATLLALFNHFDPTLLGAVLFGFLYSLLVSGPASFFALYLYVLKIEPTLFSSFQRSFNSFYVHWLLFSQIALFLLIPILFIAILGGGIYWVTGSSLVTGAIFTVFGFIYAVLLIPFSLTLLVTTIRIIFEDAPVVTSAPHPI